MLKKTLGIILILAVVSFLLFLSACRYYTPEKRVQWMMKKFSRDLKLTDSQKEQLDLFKTEMVIKGREVWVAYANTMEEMNLQLRSDEFNREQMEAAVLKITAPQAEFTAVMIEKLADFHSTLSPKQRKVLVKKLDKMKRYKGRRCRYRM